MITLRIWRVALAAGIFACSFAIVDSCSALSLSRVYSNTSISKATSKNNVASNRALPSPIFSLSRVHNHPSVAKHNTLPTPVNPKPYSVVDVVYDDTLEAIPSHHDPFANLTDAEFQTAILEEISCDSLKRGQCQLFVGMTLLSAHSLLRI